MPRLPPPNVADGTVGGVAAVDVNEDVLGKAVEHLDSAVERRYTDAETAVTEREADAVALVARRRSARGWSTSRRATSGATRD